MGHHAQPVHLPPQARWTEVWTWIQSPGYSHGGIGSNAQRKDNGMKILANNIAILDEPDQLCRWVEESGKLCHDASVPAHYLPHINVGDVVIDVGAAIGDHTIA